MLEALLVVFLIIVVLILVHSYTKMDGFSDLHSEFKTDRLKQHGNIGISTLTADTVGALGNSATKYTATTPVTTENDSPLFSGPSGLFAITKTCEAIQTMDCSAFDNPGFSLNCGMCLDIGKNSKGAPIPGGGLVLLEDDKNIARQSKVSNFMTTYVPTVGFCPAGKLVSTKEECIKLQRQLQCKKNQSFDLPGCSQCYADGSYFIVDPVENPDVVAGSGDIVVVGSGILSIVEEGFPAVTNIRLDKNTSYTYSIKGKEGTTVSLNVNSGSSDTTTAGSVISSMLYIAGYISGGTFKGEFDKDLMEITLMDRSTGRKPRATGPVTVDDTPVTKMGPGFGKKDMQLVVSIPFSFANTTTEESYVCQNGPYVTKASSVQILQSDPCYAKGSEPGKYSIDCLQNIWLSNGCTESGKYYPSNASNASLLMSNPDGSFRTSNDIANFIYNKALVTATGINEDGRRATFQNRSDASLFCTGVAITNPCEGPTKDSGPLSVECLSYLWKNGGANSSIGRTYPTGAGGTSLFGTNKNPQFCQLRGTYSPVNGAGNPNPQVVEMWQKQGGVEAVKSLMAELYIRSNVATSTDAERLPYFIKCYGDQKIAAPPAPPPPEVPMQIQEVAPQIDKRMARIDAPAPEYLLPGPKAAIAVGVQDPQTKTVSIYNAGDINSKLTPYGGDNPRWPVNSEIKFLLYNGKHWLAGGTMHSGGRLMMSNNCQNWSSVSSMDNYGGVGTSYHSALWTGSRWIVICINASKNYSIEVSTSTDGWTWAPMKIPNFAFGQHIAGTESLLVSVGMNVGHYNQPGTQFSKDGGKTWTISDTSAFLNPQYGGALMSVKYNGSLFVAGGCSEAKGSPALILYSSDGIKWNKANIPTMNWRIWNLASDGKAWIAGMQYDGILYSPDGINWQRANFKPTVGRPTQAPSVNIYPNGIIYSKSLQRWLCTTTVDVISSTDGMNWSVLYPGVGQGVVCVMADL